MRSRKLSYASRAASKKPPLPSRKKIDRMLKGLFKHGYFGVRDHCRLCEIASRKTAKQLNAAGKAKVDPIFVSRGAFAHDIFRHLAEKGMNEERVAIRYFEKMGFPELAQLVAPMESLHFQRITPKNLDKLSLEQKIVLYADGVCRGVPVAYDKKGNPTKWGQDIFALKDAYGTLLERHLSKKGSVKGKIRLLDKEFFSKWLIELELIRMGLNPEKLIKDTRRAYKVWKRKSN